MKLIEPNEDDDPNNCLKNLMDCKNSAKNCIDIYKCLMPENTAACTSDTKYIELMKKLASSCDEENFDDKKYKIVAETTFKSRVNRFARDFENTVKDGVNEVEHTVEDGVNRFESGVDKVENDVKGGVQKVEDKIDNAANAVVNKTKHTYNELASDVDSGVNDLHRDFVDLFR